MEIVVKLNQPAIEAIQRAMQDAALEAMGLLRTEVTTAQVMPFDTGTMQNARTSGGCTFTRNIISRLQTMPTPAADGCATGCRAVRRKAGCKPPMNLP